MAQVSLSIAGRNYKIACEDGHQDQVAALGHELDRRAQALSKAAGAVSEGLLLVLVGVMLADELGDAKRTAAAATEEVAPLKDQLAKAIAALEQEDEIVQRLEEMERVRGDLNAALAEAQEEMSTLRERAEAAEQRYAQAEDDHQIELDTLRTQMSEARASSTAREHDLHANSEALDAAQKDVQALRESLDGVRAENASLNARLEAASGQEQGLEARVGDLEGRLAEMKAALEAARMRLEHQHLQAQEHEQGQDAVATAIETLAERIETVAERLSAS